MRLTRASRTLAVAVALAFAAAGCGDSPSEAAAPSAPASPTDSTGAWTAQEPHASPHSRPTPTPRPTQKASPLPRPKTRTQSVSVPPPGHVVVVVLENHAAGQVIGNPSAPFINSLARTGALFTRSYAITHPSQPNYLALFSGSTQGVTSDSCPHAFHTANLGSRLRAAGRTFIGYSEGLPSVGYLGCSYGSYARKHAPWTNFPALPAKVNRPFTAFPHTYAKLPSLSFVIPDLDHDMHNGTIAAADTWLRDNLGGYLRWAKRHNSLFVLTWDEDDNGPHNKIATIITGARVKRGHYREHVTHYRVLRTLEWLEHVRPIGASAKVRPITNIWAR